ncbi:hypothetical protein Y032_0006g2790 [Ancylostoma ceylanicum]|uniref:Uncharacterized protein n=1 Tax=Ancylostoma ceylanicum TaxID=53326 RepID=A0A016VP79_9BILA|nr:hypothetical protein Y032_0006g2790 [Ancylostoma ceylanicum]
MSTAFQFRPSASRIERGRGRFGPRRETDFHGLETRQFQLLFMSIMSSKSSGLFGFFCASQLMKHSRERRR